MAIDRRDTELRLVRECDGLSVNLRPLQGLWTEEQYLTLTDHTRHLIEFTDGTIEVLPTVTDKHQVIVLFLYDLLRASLTELGGRVLFAPLRLQVRPGKQREPDISCLSATPTTCVGRTATGWAPTWLSRSSAQTTPSETRSRRWLTTPRPASPSTGSSTPRLRPSPCWPSRERPTPPTASSVGAMWPPRRCSPASPPTSAPSSTRPEEHAGGSDQVSARKVQRR